MKKLTIRNLHRMAPRGLSDLAEYFPNVRELVLSSSATDIVPAWIVGCFVSISPVNYVAKLSELVDCVARIHRGIEGFEIPRNSGVG